MKRTEILGSLIWRPDLTITKDVLYEGEASHCKINANCNCH